MHNFTGYTYDETLDLYFAQNRFYDPTTYRFTQQDPVKDSTNWYVYVDSNPLMYVDMLGLAGRVILMQHGLGAASDEFEKTVANLKGMTAANGYGYISLGIVTLRDSSKSSNVYKIDIGNAMFLFNSKEYYEKSICGVFESYESIPNSFHFKQDIIDAHISRNIANLIDEYTQNKNILIRTEFSSGVLSFEDQRLEMHEIVDMLGNFDANVTFVGHSMDGLASINYGVDYATANPDKDVDIITVSTPYSSNPYSWIVWFDPTGKLGEKFNGAEGEAQTDLAGIGDAFTNLESKWNDMTITNIQLTAISVAKAGGASEDSMNNIGDGVVAFKTQQGAGFNNVVYEDYQIISPDNEKTGLDIADRTHSHYHTKTPDLPKVADYINSLIS